MDFNYEDYISRLEASREWIWKSAQLLHRKGFQIQIPRTTKDRQSAEWKGYADDGDLFVMQRIEVKHRRIDFTSEEDFPYKSGMIVCAKVPWEKAMPKPHMFICWNKTGTHYAVIMGNTRKSWFTRRLPDSDRINYEQDFLICPLEFVQFREE